MAAAYQNGISSSPTNLLQIIVTFLSGQGWTTDSSASEGSGWRVHMHKGSLYVNMRAAMDERLWWRGAGPLYHDYGDGGYGIGLYLGDGYDGGDEWYEQSGAPICPGDSTTAGAGMNLPSGSVAAYHLFDDGSDNIAIVVERSPGIFAHMGWGADLGDSGQPEAFPYFFGSSSRHMNTHDGVMYAGLDSCGYTITAMPPMSANNRERSYSGTTTYMGAAGFVKVDAATHTERWCSNSQNDNTMWAYTGRHWRSSLNANPEISDSAVNADEYPGYQLLIDRVHQTAYAGALLLPLHCYVLTDPGARWAPIGDVPSVYWCDAVGHGYAPGTVYQVGGVDYLLFPGFAVLKGA